MANSWKQKLALGVFFLMVLGGIFQIMASPALDEQTAPEQAENSQAETVKPYRVKLIQMQGILTERPDVMALTLGGTGSTSVFDLIHQFEEYATKKSYDAVLLNFEQCPLSWAHADHLRRGIRDAREKGLKVYAYVESPTLQEYLTACVCDEIVITPTGDLPLSGLAGEAIYLKGLMDMVGLEADFISIGDYKSAAEPLTRTEPSEAEMDQTNRLFDSLYDHMVESIADGRGLKVKRVKKLIDQGPYNAMDGLKAHLVDHVMYRREFVEYLEKDLGKPVAMYVDQEQKGRDVADLSNPLSLFTVLGQMMQPPAEPSGDLIGVIHVNGSIVSGDSDEGWVGASAGSRTLRLAIQKARADARMKALVVRIDSPGGSATASDIIYHALRDAAIDKPVVVSMGSVAASGGYYIACGGSEIFAEPSTLTGSIGVVGGKIVMKELFDKIGIKTFSFKRGKNSGMFSSTEPFTKQERLWLTHEMEVVYDTFKQAVTDSRGDRLTDDIEELAQGKVYTGAQALALGLVDQIGGLDQAVAYAAEQADLKEWNLVHLPRPKSLLELLESLLADSGQNTRPTAAAALNTLYSLANQMTGSHTMGHHSLADYYLNFWTLIRQEQVTATMPTLILID